MVVESVIMNLSSNEAALCEDEIFECASFAKGDSWATGR